jgi:DNA polymerase III epsilon subunit-like protein
MSGATDQSSSVVVVDDRLLRDDQDPVEPPAAPKPRYRDVFLDTETTGLGHFQQAQVIQIAIVDAKGQVLLDTLVKPEYTPVEEDARGIHKITNEELEAKGKPWTEVWPVVHDILSRADHIWAYGTQWDPNTDTRVQFDFKILTQTNAMATLPKPDFVFTCAKELVHPILKSRFGAPPSGYRYWSLQDAVSVLAPDRQKPQVHHALDDALDMLFVLKKLNLVA